MNFVFKDKVRCEDPFKDGQMLESPAQLPSVTVKDGTSEEFISSLKTFELSPGIQRYAVVTKLCTAHDELVQPCFSFFKQLAILVESSLAAIFYAFVVSIQVICVQHRELFLTNFSKVTFKPDAFSFSISMFSSILHVHHLATKYLRRYSS